MVLDHISEFIGSYIFEKCGFQAHKTFLGYLNGEEAITYIKDKLIASDAIMNDVNAVIEYLKSASIQTTNDIALAGERMTGIEQSVAECFQSVSSGKSILASAITDKGVPADATA